MVLTFAGSMSTEFVSDPKDPVVIFMPEISRTHMGGTMRLGLRPTVFQQDSEWSRIRKLYGGASTVWERHRHRYEVNPAYVEQLHTSGLAFIGRDEKGERMQIMELPSVFSALRNTAALYLLTRLLAEHPYFVGLQAHPEFCTRPLNPSPPFLGFVAAACGPDVLEQQMAQQLQSFQPPHPKEAMIGEPALIQGSREQLPAASRERVLSISGESGRADTSSSVRLEASGQVNTGSSVGLDASGQVDTGSSVKPDAGQRRPAGWNWG